MSKLAPITSRAKMNGGIIKGKSGCGCGGGCGCGSSPAKQTMKAGKNVPARSTENPGNNVREYPIVRGGAQVQDFGGGALGALYGGGLKAGANLAMKAAGYLAKSPKTAKIAHSIQNFVKGGSKPKDYSNIRASWNGPTTVGARKNYNNVGSN